MANEKRLIDANKLRRVMIEYLNDTHGIDELAFDNCFPYWIFAKAIEYAPTVDAVEVVHGRWVATCEPDIYQCGHCKKATKMDELCDSEILRAYCPNCGADMRGKTE